MSIIIRGMEMPKNCMLCSFCVEEADPANGEMCLVTGELMPPCNHERLDDCPLIEVSEDVHHLLEYGEWTAEGNDEYGNYWDECTVCRKAVFFPPSVKNDYKYCPHCGARMDGGT